MRNKKLTFLWIGSVPSKMEILEFQKNGFTDMAAFVSQWNTIEALENYKGIVFDVINAVRVPSFPKFKKLIVPAYKDCHRDDSYDVYVPYLNINYLSLLSAECSLVRESKKWAEKHSNDDIVIIILASLTSRFLKAGLQIKKIMPNANICSIVTDLPQFMNRGKVPKIKKILKKLDWERIKRDLPKIDKFLLYTRYMAEFLKIPSDKWIEFEGIPNESKLSAPISRKYIRFTITYTGSLAKSMSILNFIEAFISLDRNDIDLKIFGSGDSGKDLIKIQKNHSNIFYGGFITNQEAFIEMQKSTLLVLPRPTEDEYTKYSCPSKIFEYMASGTPVLTTKLDGIPEEYFDYFYTFDGDSIEQMRKKLQEIVNIPRFELEKKGIMGKKFLVTQKSPDKQAEKIFKHTLDCN